MSPHSTAYNERLTRQVCNKRTTLQPTKPNDRNIQKLIIHSFVTLHKQPGRPAEHNALMFVTHMAYYITTLCCYVRTHILRQRTVYLRPSGRYNVTVVAAVIYRVEKKNGTHNATPSKVGCYSYHRKYNYNVIMVISTRDDSAVITAIKLNHVSCNLKLARLYRLVGSITDSITIPRTYRHTKAICSRCQKLEGGHIHNYHNVEI